MATSSFLALLPNKMFVYKLRMQNTTSALYQQFHQHGEIFELITSLKLTSVCVIIVATKWHIVPQVASLPFCHIISISLSAIVKMLDVFLLNLQRLVSTKKSCILEQTCSILNVWLFSRHQELNCWFCIKRPFWIFKKY